MIIVVLLRNLQGHFAPTLLSLKKAHYQMFVFFSTSEMVSFNNETNRYKIYYSSKRDRDKTFFNCDSFSYIVVQYSF